MLINPYEPPKAVEPVFSTPHQKLVFAHEHNKPNLEKIATETASKFPFLRSHNPTQHNIYANQKTTVWAKEFTQEQANVHEYVFGTPQRITNFKALVQIEVGLLVGTSICCAYTLADNMNQTALMLAGFGAIASGTLYAMIHYTYKAYQKNSEKSIKKGAEILQQAL